MGHKGSDSSSSSGSDDEYKQQKKHMSKEQKAAYKLEKKRRKEHGAGDAHARAQHTFEDGRTPAAYSPGHGFAPSAHEVAAAARAGGSFGGGAGIAFPDPSQHVGVGFPAPAPHGSRDMHPGGGGGGAGGAPAQPTHGAGFPRAAPPPSGYRIPLGGEQPFPAGAQAGPPPFRDLDGSPVFVGSALFEQPSSVHPCKIAPGLNPPARVPFGGGEHEHRGRFDLLPFVPEQMEWVPARGGAIPQGRRPIEGGYEASGGRLFHGYAVIQGIGVPGKVGEHLGGINVAFGGQEIALQDNYFILCWR